MTKQKTFSHIFFLGIGGIGMSALARCYMRQGVKVSGYDRLSSPLTDRLKAEGAEIIFSDAPDQIGRFRIW